jgi:hypothetical protein
MSMGDAQTIRFLQQENTRLQQEQQLLTSEVQASRRYVRALQRLQGTVQHFTPEKDILALLDETLECALALLDATDGSLMLVDEETDELVFVLVHGAVRETLTGHRFDRRKGIAGWVAEHGEPAIVSNAVMKSRLNSTPSSQQTPSAPKTSCMVATVAATPKRKSKRSQM